MFNNLGIINIKIRVETATSILIYRIPSKAFACPNPNNLSI